MEWVVLRVHRKAARMLSKAGLEISICLRWGSQAHRVCRSRTWCVLHYCPFLVYIDSRALRPGWRACGDSVEWTYPRCSRIRFESNRYRH